MKHCRKCNQDKLLDAFYFDSRRNTYIAPCKECRRKLVAASNNKWRNENRTRYNESARKAKKENTYGISYEDLVSLLHTQNDSCAICAKELSFTATEKAGKPHVDHCHVLGVVRGLLCLTCNTGIGMLNDSIDLLDAAKQYLQSRGAPTVKGRTVTASVSADSQLSDTIH